MQVKAVMVDGPADGKILEADDNLSGTICIAVPPSAEEMVEIMSGKSPERPWSKTAYYHRRKRPEDWSGEYDFYDFGGIS